MSEDKLVRLPDYIPLGVADRPEISDSEIVFETLREFLDRDLPPSRSLVGVPRGGTNLLPQFGWVLPWGREGSGKTSILVDLLFHAAAGIDWLGYRIEKPVRIVAIVNEGVPGGFQDKLRQKVDVWEGDRDDVLDGLAVYASPWGEFTFTDAAMAAHAYDYALDFGADYIALDPLHTLGTTGAGSPTDTEEFKHRLRHFGLWESIGFITAHHANKLGMVSGDWGRHADTVIHLEKDGKNPTTKFTVEKARPADPKEIGVPLLLEWVVETLGYERRDEQLAVRIDDETLLARILETVGNASDGLNLTDLRELTEGDNARLGKVAKDAVERGFLVNESRVNGRYRFRLPTATAESRQITLDDVETRMVDTQSPAVGSTDESGRSPAATEGETGRLSPLPVGERDIETDGRTSPATDGRLDEPPPLDPPDWLLDDDSFG